MKKVVTLFLFILLVSGCVNKPPYIEINYNQFEKKLENKESFIFYIGSSSCSFCDKYEKTLKRVVNEYKIDVYYIDLNNKNLTVEEKKELNNKINYSGTPETVFIKSGEVQGVYNRIEGAAPSSKIIEAFIRNGYIKQQ